MACHGPVVGWQRVSFCAFVPARFLHKGFRMYHLANLIIGQALLDQTAADEEEHLTLGVRLTRFLWHITPEIRKSCHKGIFVIDRAWIYVSAGCRYQSRQNSCMNIPIQRDFQELLHLVDPVLPEADSLTRLRESTLLSGLLLPYCSIFPEMALKTNCSIT